MTEAIRETPTTPPPSGVPAVVPGGGFQSPVNPATDPGLYVKVIFPTALYEGKPEAVQFQLSKKVGYDIDIRFMLVPYGGQENSIPLDGNSPDFQFVKAIRIPANQTGSNVVVSLENMFNAPDDLRAEYTERYRVAYSATPAGSNEPVYVSSADGQYWKASYQHIDVKDAILTNIAFPNRMADAVNKFNYVSEQVFKAKEYSDLQHAPNTSAFAGKAADLFKAVNVVLDVSAMSNKHYMAYELALKIEDPLARAKAEYAADREYVVDMWESLIRAGFDGAVGVGAATVAAAAVATGTAPVLIAAGGLFGTLTADFLVYNNIRDDIRISLARWFEERYPFDAKAAVPPQSALDGEIPSKIVYKFFNDKAPDQATLDRLSEFSETQFNAYKAQGVARPELGPFEALGRGFAETSEFKAKYGALDTSSFVAKAYQDAFGRASTESQAQHFKGQVTYFSSIYAQAGIGQAQAFDLAKGATVGQMLGFAALDEGRGAASSVGFASPAPSSFDFI